MTNATAQTKRPMNTGKVAFLSVVHFIHDLFTSFLAPMLPLLIEKLALSLTQAGSLTVFMRLPSLANPFLGTLADRHRLNRLFVILAPGLSATIMCSIGLAPTYGVLVVMLLTCGISIAALHVAIPVLILRQAGDQVGRGMGLFQIGGEMARTLGPLIAVWVLGVFGLEGFWPLMFVGWTASLLLWWRLRQPGQNGKRPPREVSLWTMIRQMRSILLGIFGLLVAQSFLHSAITTYLPTYLYQRGWSLFWAGVSLSIFEIAGAVGVLAWGSLSDAWGRRQVLLATGLLAPFFLIGLVVAEGPLLFAAVLLLGFTALATGPVVMAVMLENAGPNTAAANGTYMAINFAIRASIILIVGLLSDHYGLDRALWICALAGFGGLPFLLLIPAHRISNEGK